MLSRVAQTIYWMQRYRERAENVARLLGVNQHLMVDAPVEIGNQWVPMIQTTGGEELFKSKYKKARRDDVIHFLTFDLDNANSILSCLLQSRENARSVRETIPTEIWDEINTAYLFAKKSANISVKSLDVSQFYNRIVRQCQLITGMADTCMSHNEAWYFGRIGNLIERADMTTRILDVKYYMLLRSPEEIGSPYDNLQWMALLKSASALTMYRQLWHQISPEHVVDFLMLNRAFPRSVLSCLVRIENSIEEVSLGEEKALSHPHRKILEFVGELNTVSGDCIIRDGLHEFIDGLQLKLIALDKAIFDRYFSLEVRPETIRL